MRFDTATGAFVDEFITTDNPLAIAYGRDGYLYVSSDSDLDGDDYFVLWDKNILQDLKRCNVPQLYPKASLGIQVEDETSNAKRPSMSPEWLEKAQERMLDFARLQKADQLTGKLYNLAWKTAKESDKRIFDENAIAFGTAYKESLDVIKHGGSVRLPRHLHDHLAPSLRDLLHPTK